MVDLVGQVSLSKMGVVQPKLGVVFQNFARASRAIALWKQTCINPASAAVYAYTDSEF